MAASLASDRSSLGCGLSQAVVATMRSSRCSSSVRSWSSCKSQQSASCSTGVSQAADVSAKLSCESRRENQKRHQLSVLQGRAAKCGCCMWSPAAAAAATAATRLARTAPHDNGTEVDSCRHQCLDRWVCQPPPRTRRTFAHLCAVPPQRRCLRQVLLLSCRLKARGRGLPGCIAGGALQLRWVSIGLGCRWRVGLQVSQAGRWFINGKGQ